MENIINTINNYSSLIIIALLTVTIVLVVITILLLNSVNKLERKYKKLMRGTNNKNLEELINSKLDEIDNSKVSAKEALEKYELLKNQMGDIKKYLVRNKDKFNNKRIVEKVIDLL